MNNSQNEEIADSSTLLNTEMHTVVSALFAVVLAVAVTFPATINAATRLYKDYEFGISQTDLLEDSRIYDCSDLLGEEGWFCLDGQIFAGIDVEIAFGFLDESLVLVSLFAEFSQQNYLDLFFTLNSKFQVAALGSDDRQIDIVAQSKIQESSELVQEVNNYEKFGLQNWQLTYTLIESRVFEKYAVKSANMTEMIQKADEDVRAADYMVMVTDEGDPVIIIRFYAPRRTQQMIQRRTENDYGDF